MATVKTIRVRFLDEVPPHEPNVTYVYRIINTRNDKGYVGVTDNLGRRREKHLHEKSCPLLATALRKYGKESFLWEVLFQHQDGAFVRNVMEPYFIGMYRTFCGEWGYNLTYGGDGGSSGEGNPFFGKKHTAEARQRMSEIKKGKPSPRKGVILSVFTKDKIKKSKENIGNSTRQKMSLAKLGKESPKKGSVNSTTSRIKTSVTKLAGRVILQVERDTRRVVKVFKDMWSVLQVFPGKRRGINACLNGQNKTSCGYEWQYRRSVE